MSDIAETIEFRETSEALLPEGWYVNEADTDTLRWWTGNSWTDRVKPMPADDETVTEAPARVWPWSTLSVWAIVGTPYLAAVALAFAFALSNAAAPVWQVGAVLALPYIWAVLFAPLDELRLRRWGYLHTANWAWVFLTAPAYLVARTIVLQRNAGVGSATLWMWVVNVLLVIIALGAFVMLSGPAITVDEVVGMFTFSSLGLPQP